MELCYNQEMENLKRQINIQTKRLNIREKQVEILEKDNRLLVKVNSTHRKEYTKLQEHLENVNIYNCVQLEKKEKVIESLHTTNKTLPCKKQNKKDKIKKMRSRREVAQDDTGSNIGKTDVVFCNSRSDYQGSKLHGSDNFREQFEVDNGGILDAEKIEKREGVYEKFWREKMATLDKKYDYLLKALLLKAKYLNRATIDSYKIKEAEKENSILKQDLQHYQGINQKLEIELANHAQILMVRNSDLWQRFLELKQQRENVNLPNPQIINERISELDHEVDESVRDNLEKGIETSAEQTIPTCPQCGCQLQWDIMCQFLKQSNHLQQHTGENFERLSKYVSMAVDLKLRNLNKVRQTKSTLIDLKQKLRGLQLKVEKYRAAVRKMERERELYIKFTAEICKQMGLLFDNIKLA